VCVCVFARACLCVCVCEGERDRDSDTTADWKYARVDLLTFNVENGYCRMGWQKFAVV
jgi:hypothetical protein